MYKQVSKTCISEKKKQFCSNIPKNYQPIQHNPVTQSNLPRERKRIHDDVQTPTWHQVILLLYRSITLWFSSLIKRISCQWQVQFFKTNLYAGLPSGFNQQSFASLSLLIQASCELSACVQNCRVSSAFTGQFDRAVRNMKFCCRSTSWLSCLAQLWWKQDKFEGFNMTPHPWRFIWILFCFKKPLFPRVTWGTFERHYQISSPCSNVIICFTLKSAKENILFYALFFCLLCSHWEAGQRLIACQRVSCSG